VRFVAVDSPVWSFSAVGRATANVPSSSTNVVSVTPAPGIATAVLDSGVGEHHDLNVAGRADFTSFSSAGPVFRDEFPSQSWDGSAGSDEWSSPWLESGESDGSGSGFVRVYSSSRCASGYCLRLGANLDDDGYVSACGAEREVDLTGVADATLTYSYRRDGSSSGWAQVDVEASGDGGDTWVLAASHLLDGYDEAQVTASLPLQDFVTPSHQTRVRFTFWGKLPAESPHYLYVDNVEIESTDASSDPFGHGTHVAGIVGGSGKVSAGHQPGVAPGASLYSVRVLDGEGMGTVSDVVAGLDWVLSSAASSGIRVVNLSLGKALEESADTDPLVQAVEAVWDAGIVVVVSAGNYGTAGHFTITSPGNSPKVITVGSVTDAATLDLSDDYVSTYSSRGPTLIDHYLKPDLVAPGNRIIAPIAANSKLKVDLPERIRETGDYLELSGTSMAAPMVSGAAVLMLSQDPTLTPATVKARLMRSARKISGDPTVWGAGVLDVVAALGATGEVKTAPSPQMNQDDSGAILVEDTAQLWGSTDWDATFLWSDGYMWSNGFPWSNGYPWSTGYPWSLVVEDLTPLWVVDNQSLLLNDDPQ